MTNLRTVTVFATKGNNKTKIETDVKTWGEIKPLLVNAGYDLPNLAATENVTRRGLDNDLSVLPEGNFVIFLRPVKTKSGVDLPHGNETTRKELKAIIKEAGKPMKAYLKTIIEGRNWTQLDTETLRDAVAAYGNEEVVEEVIDVVKEVKALGGTLAEADAVTFDSILNDMEIIAEGNEEAMGYVNEIKEAKANFDAAIEGASEDKAETEALIAEWNIIKAGF